MNIELAEFANFFDIFCLTVILISALFSLKGGLLKNLLNLVKWIVVVLVLKYSFDYLRVPFKNTLDLSPTLTDISIFISVFIISYVMMTIVNRLIVGLISSDRSGPIDRLFGVIFGIVRGYIIVVMIFSVLNNWYFSKELLRSYGNESVLFESIDKGKKLFQLLPLQIEKKLDTI
jgi:membrane protein required for colicin V production